MRNRHGETLVETLVAILVIALGMILFVNMLQASGRLITRSEQVFHDNTSTKNQIESGNTEAAGSSTAKFSGGSFTSDDDSFSWSGGTGGVLSDAGIILQKSGDVTVTYKAE